MISFAIAAVTAALSTAWATSWAWALPVAGPLVAAAVAWWARARARVPSGIGSGVVAIACLVALGWAAWRVSERFANPAPQTWTQAEIDAAAYAAEAGELRRAAAAGELARQRQQHLMSALAEQNSILSRDLEQARAKSIPIAGPVVRLDDEWLRSWQRRGR